LNKVIHLQSLFQIKFIYGHDLSLIGLVQKPPYKLNDKKPKNYKEVVCMVKKLPESGRPIVRLLEKEGPLTQRDIIARLNIPTRTIRYGIRRLMEKGYIKKLPNLRDMRSVYYYISPDIDQDLLRELLEEPQTQ